MQASRGQGSSASGVGLGVEPGRVGGGGETKVPGDPIGGIPPVPDVQDGAEQPGNLGRSALETSHHTGEC